VKFEHSRYYKEYRFAAAVKETLLLARNLGCSWFVAIDADIVLFPKWLDVGVFLCAIRR